MPGRCPMQVLERKTNQEATKGRCHALKPVLLGQRAVLGYRHGEEGGWKDLMGEEASELCSEG